MGQKLLMYLVLIYVFFCCSAVDLMDFYPFGELNGDTVLPRGENQCDSVKMKIPFYDGTHIIGSDLYVSTNGYIGSDISHCSYSYGIQPSQQFFGRSMTVAPFCTLTHTGIVQYRETYDTNVLNRVNRDIGSTGLLSYNATNALIATWINVTNTADSKNSFQAVVTSDGFYTFAIFYYNKITWNQGDNTIHCDWYAGNYCPAFAGFLLYNSFECFTCNQKNVMAKSSNINRPGVWVTRLYTNLAGGKQISSIQPVYVDMMGHRSSNTMLPDNFNTSVNFFSVSNYFPENIFSNCEFISNLNNETKLACFEFFYSAYGSVPISIYGVFYHWAFSYYSYIFVKPPVPEVHIKVLNESVVDYSVSIELKWNAQLIATLNPGCETVNISMHIFDPEEGMWNESVLIKQNVNNSGEMDIKLIEPNSAIFLSKHLLIGVSKHAGLTNGDSIFSKMFIFELDSFNLKRKVKSSGNVNILATVDMMGHRKLNISFRTTPGQDGLGCKFDDANAANYPTTSAIPSSNNQYVTCYVPFLYMYGIMHVSLFSGYTATIDINYRPQLEQLDYKFNKSDKFKKNADFRDGDLPLILNIDVLPSYPRLAVEQVGTQTTSNGQFQLQMQFTWDPREIPKEYPVLNAFIYQFDDERNQWMKELMVSPQNIPPSAGSVPVTLSQEAITVFFNYKVMFGLGYVQGNENFVIFSKMYIPGVTP